MTHLLVTFEADGQWHLQCSESARGVVRHKDREYVVWLAMMTVLERGGSFSVREPDPPRALRRVPLKGLEYLHQMISTTRVCLQRARALRDIGYHAPFSEQAKRLVSRMETFVAWIDERDAIPVQHAIDEMKQDLADFEADSGGTTTH